MSIKSLTRNRWRYQQVAWYSAVDHPRADAWDARGASIPTLARPTPRPGDACGLGVNGE